MISVKFPAIVYVSVRTALNLSMLRGRHTPNILESQQRTACECSKAINKQKYKTPLLMNMMLQNQFKVKREAVWKKKARSIKVVN